LILTHVEMGVEDNLFADAREIRECARGDGNEIADARNVEDDGFVATISDDSAQSSDHDFAPNVDTMWC
jgi:hypothetical protein